MQLPRKGILIRIVIYGTLILFFGIRALLHWLDVREAERNAEASAAAPSSRTVTMPDGSAQEILYLTPEEAERRGFKMPADMKPSEVGPAPEASADPPAAATTPPDSPATPAGH